MLNFACLRYLIMWLYALCEKKCDKNVIILERLIDKQMLDCAL